MSQLYILATDARVNHVASKAQSVIISDAHLEVIRCAQSNRLAHLLSLINANSRGFDHTYFAVDGRDSNTVADFNAFLRALRMCERINGSHPAVIRSINIL